MEELTSNSKSKALLCVNSSRDPLPAKTRLAGFAELQQWRYHER